MLEIVAVFHHLEERSFVKELQHGLELLRLGRLLKGEMEQVIPRAVLSSLICSGVDENLGAIKASQLVGKHEGRQLLGRLDLQQCRIDLDKMREKFHGFLGRSGQHRSVDDKIT